jgi:RNA polymerase sigma factor (sigma-70 family)
MRPTCEWGDGELVASFAETRNEDAFAELVCRHGPMVLAVCRRALYPDSHTADDAFQATFLVLATKAALIRPADQVGAWLHGVAVRVARRARAWVGKIAQSSPTSLDEFPSLSHQPDPDAADLRALIDDVLACLPAKYRSPVVLCDLEGKSRKQAATALGWSEGTLSGRLCRARKLLAERLARRGVALPIVGGSVGILAQPALAVVPPQLVASTIHAAALLAAGAATTEVVSQSVAAFTRGGYPSMSATALKFLVAGFGCLGLALGGFSLLTPQAAAEAKREPIPVRIQMSDFVSAAKPEEPKGWLNARTFKHNSPLTALAFGPDIVVSSDSKAGLIVWNAKLGKEKEVLVDVAKIQGAANPIERIQISSDGAWIYMVGSDGQNISQCSVAKEKRIFPGVSFGPAVKFFGVSADGELWLKTDAQVGQGKKLILFQNKFAENTVGFLVQHTFDHKDIVDFAVAGDKDVIATIAGGTLRRWEKGNEKPTWEVALDGFEPTRLVIAPGGEIIAASGKNGEVRLFNAKAGKSAGALKGHMGSTLAIAFDADGKRIATGGEDKTVRVWDLEAGKEIAVLKGHADAVVDVAFSPSGETIASGSKDGTVKLWEFKK